MPEFINIKYFIFVRIVYSLNVNINIYMTFFFFNPRIYHSYKHYDKCSLVILQQKKNYLQTKYYQIFGPILLYCIHKYINNNTKF